MGSNEDIIIGILKESNCYGQENMITPAGLIAKCKERGLSNSREIEAAIVSLIDQDIVEYEMDDDLNTTELWLM